MFTFPGNPALRIFIWGVTVEVRIARATLPATVDLQVIQGGYAYGVQQGGSDDPMVVIYEIQE